MFAFGPFGGQPFGPFPLRLRCCNPQLFSLLCSALLTLRMFAFGFFGSQLFAPLTFRVGSCRHPLAFDPRLFRLFSGALLALRMFAFRLFGGQPFRVHNPLAFNPRLFRLFSGALLCGLASGCLTSNSLGSGLSHGDLCPFRLGAGRRVPSGFGWGIFVGSSVGSGLLPILGCRLGAFWLRGGYFFRLCLPDCSN